MCVPESDQPVEMRLNDIHINLYTYYRLYNINHNISSRAYIIIDVLIELFTRHTSHELKWE